MQLDVLTLLLILGTGCILLGTVLLIAWLKKRSEYGVLWWSISLFVRAPGFALIMLRGKIADWLSIDLGLALLLLGVGISWSAARLQSRRPASIAVALAPAVLWLIACQFPDIRSSTSNRVAFVSAELSVYTLAIAWEFWRQSRTQGRLRTALAVLFLVSGAVHLLRAVFAATHEMSNLLPEFGNVVAGSLSFYLIILFAGGAIGISFYWEQLVRSLKYEAEYDALTDVFNRRAFSARAEHLLRPGVRRGAPAALLLFDLDHFKSVNDRFGHSGGDMALSSFCALVQGRLRNLDLFGRIGGEEFAALLPNMNRSEACRFAERLRLAIEDLGIDHANGTISLTVSIGVAVTDAANVGLEELMARADVALYEAKVRGRNRVHSAGQALNDPSLLQAPGARRTERIAV